jgi:hypothetical protein
MRVLSRFAVIPCFTAVFFLAAKAPADALDTLVQQTVTSLDGGATGAAQTLSGDAQVLQSIANDGSHDANQTREQIAGYVQSINSATAAAGTAAEFEADTNWWNGCVNNATTQTAKDACTTTYQNALNQNPALQQFANAVNQQAKVDAIAATNPNAVATFQQALTWDANAYQAFENGIKGQASTGTVSQDTIANEQRNLNTAYTTKVQADFQELINTTLPQQ